MSVTAVMPEGVALARDLVGPAMEAAIGRLTPDVRAVAAYHLGLADAAGNPTGNGSGKALRPALAVRPRSAACPRPSRWSWCTTSRCFFILTWRRTPRAGTAPPPGPSSA